MIESRAFRLGARFVALLLLLASQPGAMASSREEVESLAENEGVVVGSVLLTVPPAQQGQSGGFGFLGGRKAADLNYAVGAFQSGVIELFARGFRLSVSPMKEQFFVEKLPAGSYRLTSLSPTGFVTQMSFPLGLPFTVKAQRVTYVGQVVVALPDRLVATSRVSVDVQDSWPETLEKLRSAYPSIASATTALAGSLVPGDTRASPRLQRDTLTIVTALDGAEDKACLQRAVVNTEVIRKPTRPDEAAEERWTVDRCGTPVPYLIMYRTSERGGTDISVKPEK